MKTTIEKTQKQYEKDLKYIKHNLSKCARIKKNNIIYYFIDVNSGKDILASKVLKMNSNIKLNLKGLKYKNNIALEYNLNNNTFYINYSDNFTFNEIEIWSRIKNIYDDKINYAYSYIEEQFNEYFKTILCELFELDDCNVESSTVLEDVLISDILNMNEYIYKYNYQNRYKFGK